MNIFQSITAGDSAEWRDGAWIDLPAGNRLTSADWTLCYQLRGPAALTLDAVPDGDGWKTSMSTEQSATLTAGAYVWGAYLSRSGERKTIGGGTLTVNPDLAASAESLDARSLAQKALADCEAALATFKTSGGSVKRYSIGSRQMEFQTLADLLKLLSYWKLRVANEAAAVSIANGKGNPRTLHVRFT